MLTPLNKCVLVICCIIKQIVTQHGRRGQAGQGKNYDWYLPLALIVKFKVEIHFGNIGYAL